MNYIDILIPVAVMASLGLIFGIILYISSKFFAVKPDTLLSSIRSELPGANCGGCGYGTCDSYSKALSSEDVAPNLCTVGGKNVAQKLGELTGRAVEDTKPTGRAVVCCSGGKNTTRKFDYVGLEDCFAAANLAGGPISCEYGCLGLGSCVKVCPSHALSIADGIAKVDPSKCICCGMCVKACPKQIIKLIPREANVLITCMSKSTGSDTRRYCTAGCIGCRICEKTCSTGAITVDDNLACIDYSKCTSCGECAGKCPRKLIIVHDKLPIIYP